MRLIDADALFNWGKHKLSDAVKYGNKVAGQQHFSYSTLMMYEIADEIEEAPTIDAVPVVHGKWINESKPNEDKNVNAECSVCHAGDLHAVNVVVPYCWKCGAKMDKEASNNA